ncbi:RHS repeat-associated core domain-containing protein [Empedobacter brevis]|uniref:RHS repeat-associated core domain-containing protein n=1 Tax=Empedobacter brevis TaxID=247 RepID=UPI0021AA1D17|nr:RHS repeat-associated core domain-containing protein [Empedobacter brevis]
MKVLEENNYYPFGLKHKGYNNTNLANANYKYKYNGKELQDDFNINLYDYGARNYDPAIGRWFNIDPLAEKSKRFSPYTYALNNPVYFIDPDGMAAEDWKQDRLGNYVYDASLTKENASTKLAEGETYLGPSASINVDNKATGETGSLNLNENGTASLTMGNTTQSIENTTEDFGFASGHLVMAGNHGKGTYSEINFNWAAIGGFGFAFGNVTDSYGKSSWYFSVNGNAGYGGGGGFEYGGITPTTLGGRFELKDFQGEGSQYNLSIPGSPISVGSGGSYDTSVFGTGLNKMDYNNFGQNKNGYTTQSFGGGIGPGTKIGAMFSNGKTWLIK